MFFKLLKLLYKQAVCSHSFMYIKTHNNGAEWHPLKEFECIYCGKKIYQ